jgi:methyltransferase-like protein
MAHEMMAFHVRSMDEQAKQTRQARGLLHVLIECQRESTTYKAALERELERITKYQDGEFYHDDLSPNYHPVFFHQFIDHAEKHGLQYLGERCESALDPGDYPERIQPALRQLSACGIVEREQYLDFIYARRFRCTFLCRKDVTVQWEGKESGVSNLHVGLTRSTNLETRIDAEGSLHFTNDSGTLATTKHPLLVAAVGWLLKMRPKSIPFPELLDAARANADRSAGQTAGREADAGVLRSFVLKCYMTQFLALSTWKPRCADGPSERPVASPVARALVRTVRFVPSLYHEPVNVQDVLGQRLLELLDGTRDRPALLTELNAIVERGEAQLPDGAAAVTPSILEQKLGALAKFGLLTD